MKKVVTLACICTVLLMLDNTLVTFFAIKSVYPNLLFVFIIAYSIINGSADAVGIGIFAGALQDLYLFNGIGVNMFTNMILCYLASYIGKSIFKDKSFVPIVATLFLSLLKGAMVLGIFYLLKIKINEVNILYVSLYNMIISAVMYKYVYKLSETKFIKKEWRF